MRARKSEIRQSLNEYSTLLARMLSKQSKGEDTALIEVELEIKEKELSILFGAEVVTPAVDCT